MSKYSGYIAYIYKGEDIGIAQQKGEDMKAKFDGADYELVDDEPAGLCSFVEPDDEKGRQIKDWLNLTP